MPDEFTHQRETLKGLKLPSAILQLVHLKILELSFWKFDTKRIDMNALEEKTQGIQSPQ